jgi:hypothetical protein
VASTRTQSMRPPAWTAALAESIVTRMRFISQSADIKRQ